jgi:hypothetical protein
VVREGVGAGGRNDPSLVCTYELKKKKKEAGLQSSYPCKIRERHLLVHVVCIFRHFHFYLNFIFIHFVARI